MNIENSARLEFDFKCKHYKFKVHMSLGRYCFSSQEKVLPKALSKTKSNTEMFDYCAKPQRFKDAFRSRGCKNVEIVYDRN